MQRLFTAVGGFVGLGLGALLWAALFGDFQTSVDAQVFEGLKQVPSFGTLLAVSAVAVIMGTGFLVSYLSGLISKALLKRRILNKKPHEVASSSS